MREKAIDHSRVLVFCMSANAFGSDWAQLEVGTFRFRDPLNQERRFIPLRLDVSSPTRLDVSSPTRLDKAPIKGTLAQFLYLNWLPQDREQEYAKLHDACRPPWLDKWNLSPGDTISDALEQAIKTIPCAALCFGPNDISRWHILEIRAYVEKWASGTARMIPVILHKVEETPELPLFVRQTLWVDLREWENDESDGFYRLVCGILGRAPGDSPMKRFGVRDVAEWQGASW